MLRGKVLERIGALGGARVFAGVGVCAVLLLATASGQAADTRGAYTCTGPVDLSELMSNLTVPAGARCGLVGDIADGNISVAHGARFAAIGTLIKGSVSTEGAEAVSLIDTEVDGNASVDATDGPSTFFCFGGGIGDSVCLGPGNRFLGNVTVAKTSPAEAVVRDNSIAHDLICTGNEAVTDYGEMNTVLGQDIGQCVGL